ncbi:MAG: DUF192 domain-containing protein [Candidatus Omnitrophota bacterium]
MNNPKESIFFIYLFLFVLYGFLPAEAKEVCIKDACLEAEVVSTDLEKQRGLMYRESLAQGAGMLFVFEEEKIHAFWMKNMRFPLDIIWADADKKIVDIYENVSPCPQEACNNIIPKAPAQFVLEVNSGFVEKNKIKTGDFLEF